MSLAVYIDELVKVDPRLLRFACDQWARQKRKFPYLSELLSYIEANTAEPVPQLEGPSADGAVHRNEAINLLGTYLVQAKTLIGDNTPEYCEFIAEAGRLWAKVRPDGGLADVDAARTRAANGFALEAWARSWLGDAPLHPAYCSEAAARLHRAMTGNDLLTSNEPVLRPSGSLSDLIAAVTRGP